LARNAYDWSVHEDEALSKPTKLNIEHDIGELEEQIARLQDVAERHGLEVAKEVGTLEKKLAKLKKQAYDNLTSIERVQLARHPKRPFTLDYVERTFSDFIELHGDRAYRDDEAIVGGWARLDGESVMVIGHQKGRDMKENMRRNFGMAHPLMQQAEKFGRPIITLIDTPGAYPGIGAEERGQAEAIARNLREMARLRVPVIAVVIGEGGSGGALALGVADRVLMLENAVYSVITPEGCAAILWKTATAKDKAAEALKVTAGDLAELGVVDAVIPEPTGGAHNDWDVVADSLRDALVGHLRELKSKDADALRQERWEKFESMGAYRVV
jgi:acetyl-CoA carboxylase carboxyl transferase subunit alpha